MVRSSGFGSIRSDRSRPIQTRFRSGFGRFRSLTKPLPISRQSILPKVRSQVIRLSYRLSAYGFMFYFTPRQGFSFTFPSRYLFAIGHSGVFSLTRWSSLIHTGFHVSHATRDMTLTILKNIYNYRTFTIYGAGFSCFVLYFKNFL